MENLSFKIHHVFILQEFLLAFLVIVFTIIFEAVSQRLQAGESPDSSNCIHCHSDVFETNLTKTNVHPPFLQQQCSVCHLDDETTVEDEDNIIASKKKILWFDANFTPANKHWFKIPFDLLSRDQIIVVASDESCETLKVMLPLPPIGMLQQIEKESKPYTITPELLGVYQGIFVSAVIGWTTEDESDSEVLYGIDSLRYSVKKDNFSNEHKVVLQNLKSNQKYQYIVVSKDIFGNRVESEIAFFSTEKLSPAPPVNYEQHKETDIQLDAQYFRNDDSYFVIINANHPVRLRIGSYITNKKDRKVFEASISSDQNHYLSMRNGNDLMISVCKKCHPGRMHIAGHKIYKFPPAGTQITADYSTSSDGRITCVTCHASHASNYESRTIKASSLELCVGCHKGYLPLVSEVPMDANLAP